MVHNVRMYLKFRCCDEGTVYFYRTVKKYATRVAYETGSFHWKWYAVKHKQNLKFTGPCIILIVE